jgi:2-oxoacid:acceptor oxidoreductase delta subunit (pyruvate/2-ketoisovalerate family)
MAIKKKFESRYESSWSNANESLLYLETGTWRTARPKVDVSKCNYCGICAMYCPPQCLVNKGDHFEPNLEFCKGCGVCVKECPRKAITMVPEE